jgi:hypothetical protein
MLDDLRNSSSFIDEEPPAPEQEPPRPRAALRRRQKDQFLGMSAQQRFILSLMLFLMLCVIGTFALLLFGKIALPF